MLSAQTGNGTITGVVTDPTGAVVANAPIEVKNTETGVVFRAVSTDTGNYTIPQVPVGKYELSATVQGFKKFSRQNLTIVGAQVLRVDVPLEIGASTETVTVSAESTLLQTETGDLVAQHQLCQLQNLPLLGVGQRQFRKLRHPQSLQHGDGHSGRCLRRQRHHDHQRRAQQHGLLPA